MRQKTETRIRVDNCQSLDELSDVLAELEKEWRAESVDCFHDYLGELGVQVHDFPVFGGDEPEETVGIWSWDEERLMVTGVEEQFALVDRAEWGDTENARVIDAVERMARRAGWTIK